LSDWVKMFIAQIAFLTILSYHAVITGKYIGGACL
jgi:hypothetical protein